MRPVWGWRFMRSASALGCEARCSVAVCHRVACREGAGVGCRPERGRKTRAAVVVIDAGHGLARSRGERCKVGKDARARAGARLARPLLREGGYAWREPRRGHLNGVEERAESPGRYVATCSIDHADFPPATGRWSGARSHASARASSARQRSSRRGENSAERSTAWRSPQRTRQSARSREWAQRARRRSRTSRGVILRTGRARSRST